MKQLHKFLAVLALVSLAILALAQNTVGGTIISNTATATFTDSNGVNRSTQSNTVQTTVQTVYSFNISPDDSMTPTATSNFAGYAEADGNNTTGGAIGDQVVFTYTITNNTNNPPADPLSISLNTVQSTTDDFNLTNVAIWIDDGDGIFNAALDTLYTPGVSTFELPAQGDDAVIFVVADIPSGVNGNQVALIDLVATNTDAVAAGKTGPNVSFESNNMGRVEVDEIPVLGAAKNVDGVTNNADGTYTVDYTITLENLGNVPLSYIQAVEVLSTTFSGATFSVDSLTSADFTVNGSFTGSAPNTNLLSTAASNDLAIGASGTIALTVTVTPGSNLGPYNNSVTATGFSPDDVAAGGFDPLTSTPSTSDISDNGTDPDPDGDGNPNESGENDATPVTFTENPVLGVAKSVGTTVDNGDGTFNVTVTFTIENSGDVEVRNVQLVDDLRTTFPAPVTFSIVTAPAGAGLSYNAAYDGDTDGGANPGHINLLSGTNTIPAGVTRTVTMTIQFDPNGETGPFNNTATVTGTSPAGTSLTDDSDNGSDPDGNNDNDPTNDSDPTPITFTEDPQFGLAKAVSGVTALTGANLGLFDVAFVVTIENTGNVDLINLRVQDDLNTTFPAPATYSVQVGPASTTLTPNTGFNGNTDKDLLSAPTTIEPGDVHTVTFTVRVDPNGVASFENVVNGSADSPGGATVSDDSTNGTDPDANGDVPANDGDGDPNNTDSPTPISFPENPVLGIAKNTSAVTNNGNGTYSFSYTLTVMNYGNVDLTSVQVSDNLATTFAAATSYTVNSISASAGFTANTVASFNSTNNLLVAASSTLPVGTTRTITLAVTVTPGSNLGPYNNVAVASANSPEGTGISDNSTNGTDPDANGDIPANDGDGNPNNTSSNTPVSFTENPVIGLAKSATASVNATGFPGQFETTITMTVENLGNIEIRNLQITDDLDAIFTGAATVSAISGLTSPTLTVNPAFNGTTNVNLLAGTDTLAVGATATVSFTVRFNPNGETGPFNNTATATGTSPAGATVTDDSTEGSNPDPDGNDNPDENDTTPISFTETPVIGVAKAATITGYGNTDPDLGALGPFTVRLDFALENFGNVNVLALTLTDDLDAAFGAGNYSVTAGPTLVTPPATSTINLNAGFNGNTDQNLIASGSNLAIGETAVIRITVQVTDPGAYSNQATASGTGPGGTATTDPSDSGTDPDTDGNGIPNEAGNNDPTLINLDALQLSKSVRTCDDVNCATVLVANGATAEPGDYLEYTIEAENIGDQSLSAVVIMDAIPSWTLPIAGSSQYVSSTNTTAGIECSTDGGTNWGACPAGPSTTVTHVRLNVGTLTAGSTATLTFVVLVP